MIALLLLACSEYEVTATGDPTPTPLPEIAPVAIAGPGQRTPRDEAVSVDGTSSYDPDVDDALLEYEWTVLSSPDGSNPELTLTDEPHARFSADVLGRYELQLVVTDEDGLVSEPAVTVVEVVPWTDLTVALKWDKAVDLDVHLVRPDGAFYGDGDCFFADPSPDWGVAGDATDDPELDADDDQGGGPEKVTLQRPEEGVYTVLVEFFNARDASASPTPHLRINGAGKNLVDEDGPKLAAAGTVWIAGTLDWSTLTFTQSDDLTTHDALGAPPVNEK